MRHRLLSALVILSLFTGSLSNAAALESFAPLVERSLPAVVNISTTQKIKTGGVQIFPGLPGMPGMPDMEKREELEKFLERFGFPNEGMEESEREVSSLGSGFIIDPDGYIVTNNHVIAEASEIVVTFHDESKLDAKVVGRDPKTDLALLKVESSKPLPYVEFGNSDNMRVGDWIIAIGNPFGLGNTVTAGIISARSRHINAGPFDDFLQTDAAINRGNSGGPMFNQQGEVIGVNTAIFSPSGGNIGIGFAIPSAMAKPLLDQLRQYGKPYRGWLGVKIQYVTKEIADSLGLNEEKGALVLELTPDSPAQKAGIQPGDVITAFNGRAIKEMRELPRIVAETPVGQKVTVEIWRNNRNQSLSMVLGEFPEEETAAASSKEEKAAPEKSGKLLLGMYLRDATSVDKENYRITASQEGVFITGVEPGGIAEKRAIQPGDMIIGVNQEKVESLKAFEDAVSEARKAERDYVLVRIMRGSESSYVTLPLKEKE